MRTKEISTRRRFFWSAAAALSAPLAVTASAAAARDEDREALEARLAWLEDIAAIRELQRSYARLLSSGAREEARQLFADPAQAQIDARIEQVSADSCGDPDSIAIAADRASATARIQCAVTVATPIGPSCTLVEMARAQGEGVVRGTSSRVLECAYVRRSGAWKIARLSTRT